jgi:hypothetical protein
MRRLLVALLIALSGVVFTQTPAHACKCAPANTGQHIKKATTVLLGTITAMSKQGNVQTYEVRVEKVFKGVATPRVTLRTASQSATCGLSGLATDRRYVIFGTRQGDVFQVNSCGGTAPVSTTLMKSVRGVLGFGREPQPVSAPDPEPLKPSLTRVNDTEPEKFRRLAAPGGALVIVGLLGLLLLGRVTRVR